MQAETGIHVSGEIDYPSHGCIDLGNIKQSLAWEREFWKMNIVTAGQLCTRIEWIDV